MSARAEFGPLTWEEMEQNVAGSLDTLETNARFRPADLLASPAPTVEPSEPANSTDTRGNLLRSEIKRGKEYLEQVEKELSESRRLMEQWPAYERVCGRNPLPQLIQAISTNEQIKKFLHGWLKRQEEKLEAINKELEQAGNKSDIEHPNRKGMASARRAVPISVLDQCG